MPFLSTPQTSSPMPSPSSRRMSMTKMAVPSLPLTYIPPLIDGACGTVLRAEQPMMPMLRDDARAMMGMMPMLFTALWTELLSHFWTMSWANMHDMLIHLVLAVMEMYMMMALVPLWMAMPGAVFALWFCACALMIMGLASMLNGKSRMLRCMAGSDGWMMGQEAEDERWIYVGGMELSCRRLSKTTLPALCKLFSRSFTALHMPTYGLPLDLLALMLQRTMPLPTSTSRMVYTQLRSSLLDPSVNRVVVLSHNLGSLPVSRALSQLCCDLPSDKLCKLEIYTFGAAAGEFVMPTGEPPQSAPSSPSLPNGHSQPMLERRPTCHPHIEHFALACDPFARMGVLRSARETLSTRFCGGIFVMCPPTRSASATATATSGAPAMSQAGMSARLTVSARAGLAATALSMATYLTALFPTQMTSCRGASSALDEVMLIDREVAEKREFAAMSNVAALRSGAPREGKKERLSWTGLGATAGTKRNGVSAVMDGVAGLEMARKGCRDCDGHRGREVSWLVRYVNVGCVEGMGEGEGGMNGMHGMNGMNGMNGIVNGDVKAD